MEVPAVQELMYRHLEGHSRLIVRRDDVQKPYTNRCEGDCRSVLITGLADYLRQLVFEAPEGRQLAFKEVVETFSMLEDSSDTPRAGVMSAGDDGEYAPSDLGMRIRAADEMEITVDPEGRYVNGDRALYAARPAEFRCNLQIEIVANDPESRKWLVKMLEDDLNPAGDNGSDPQVGICLELPHYHGARAYYGSKQSSRYEEDTQKAKQGLFRAWYSVDASVTQIRIVERRRSVLPRVGLAVATTPAITDGSITPE